ncbi:hypothetical protein GA0070558_106134 [Micromonospora haikouensis]|uniref:Uncharacterized protein n=1 Tax=Micromonospora haikouensis TaxID=686309 RepID=A0A1C4V302_9ACTN|nr:hypothetical protein GA0070558_106134 [Micromonospora haikouensis]
MQSHSWVWVPLVVLPFGTSTQRPDWPPTTCLPCAGLLVGVGVGEDVGGVVPSNWVKKLHTTGRVQDFSPGAYGSAEPSTALGACGSSNGAHATG